MSDLSVDVDYINKLSLYLEQFKLVRQDVWNARCPICGDSKKKLTKKRFYIYFNADKGYYSTKCHNCGHGAPFSVFLKENYPDLYRDYIVEKFPRNQKKLSPARFSKDIKKIVKEQRAILTRLRTGLNKARFDDTFSPLGFELGN